MRFNVQILSIHFPTDKRIVDQIDMVLVCVVDQADMVQIGQTVTLFSLILNKDTEMQNFYFKIIDFFRNQWESQLFNKLVLINHHKSRSMCRNIYRHLYIQIFVPLKYWNNAIPCMNIFFPHSVRNQAEMRITVNSRYVMANISLLNTNVDRRIIPRPKTPGLVHVAWSEVSLETRSKSAFSVMRFKKHKAVCVKLTTDISYCSKQNFGRYIRNPIYITIF